MSGLWTAIKSGFKNVFNFRGRMRRSDYWMFIVSVIVISVGLLTGFFYLTECLPLYRSTMNENSYELVFMLLVVLLAIVFFIIPLLLMLGATVRRLHDFGHSGLLAWLTFACLVSSIISFSVSIIRYDMDDPSELMVWVFIITCILVIVTIVLCMKDSMKGVNQYGDSPKWEQRADI